jgi:D-beta-D-heptose 7-phosphate kinase/D-beta-D-heptose 1-phosphate adenosyltransferase
VFDVSGAGDTVMGVLAVCLASRVDPESAADLANVAAGIVVGRAGTVPITRSELLAEIRLLASTSGPQKLLNRDELLIRVAEWRAAGQRVVFTNGCFDILHLGHITLLDQCRQFGDKVVVAINSDRSVRCLKGPERPVVGEHERARVLAALGAIDAVVIFDEETPLEIIRSIRPEVLVKGGDYSVETVVGAEDVLSWGGAVQIVPIVPGHSTSNTIDRMKAL